MRIPKTISVICLILLFSLGEEAKSSDSIPFEVKRLSERISVLTGIPVTCQVIALASEKGLVIFDTGLSRSFALDMKQIIQQEYGRKEFAYVINTHAHRDHSGGNQVFADSTIIAHEKCFEALSERKANWTQETIDKYVSLHREREEKFTSQLASLDSESEEARWNRLQIAVQKRIISDYSEGHIITLPDITFSDRMTVDLGDLTLRMFFYGRAHTDSDIIIHVPEEGVLIAGDLFHRSYLPGLYSSRKEVDVPKWLEVLDFVLNRKDQLKYIICGHNSILTGEEIAARRDYIREMWDGIVSVHAEGLDISEALKRFPLEKFSHLMKLVENDYTELQQQHEILIQGLWNQLQAK
jgi:glyoxylase-like metal-dependent hydrolase (beta-lactamase superfamily II)